eukprot:m.64006 g.64006  ORF g.64006 m.64006 type:complete len:494 (+) comp9692_c0_seq2:526-2007(+)
MSKRPRTTGPSTGGPSVDWTPSQRRIAQICRQLPTLRARLVTVESNLAELERSATERCNAAKSELARIGRVAEDEQRRHDARQSGVPEEQRIPYEMRDPTMLSTVASITHAMLGMYSKLKERGGSLSNEATRLKAQIAKIEVDREVVVVEPVSNGRDPTLWLPDELLLLVLLSAPFEAVWTGVCGRVCRRWRALCTARSVKRRMWQGRWAAYSRKEIVPKVLLPPGSWAGGLAVGGGNDVYTSSDDSPLVQVRSSRDGSVSRTLRGHTGVVWAFAFGNNGKVYTGSQDATVRVWSAATGAHLATLEGHTLEVLDVAVGGPDNRVCSGSADGTVRLWSGDDGSALRTISGLFLVCAVAVGRDGQVYAGQGDGTIQVHSGEDGARLRVLDGHLGPIAALGVAGDGMLFSAAHDGTVRMWTADQAFALSDAVTAIALDKNDNVCIASVNNKIQMWGGQPRKVVRSMAGTGKTLRTLTFGNDGRLFGGTVEGGLVVW